MKIMGKCFSYHADDTVTGAPTWQTLGHARHNESTNNHASMLWSMHEGENIKGVGFRGSRASNCVPMALSPQGVDFLGLRAITLASGK